MIYFVTPAVSSSYSYIVYPLRRCICACRPQRSSRTTRQLIIFLILKMSLLQKLSPVLACQLSWPVVVSTCAAGGILTGCLAAYYLRKIAVRPRLFGSQKITNFLTQHVPATQERFWPTWWAFNAILSTLARVVIQRVKPTHYRR